MGQSAEVEVLQIVLLHELPEVNLDGVGKVEEQRLQLGIDFVERQHRLLHLQFHQLLRREPFCLEVASQRLEQIGEERMSGQGDVWRAARVRLGTTQRNVVL